MDSLIRISPSGAICISIYLGLGLVFLVVFLLRFLLSMRWSHHKNNKYKIEKFDNGDADPYRRPIWWPFWIRMEPSIYYHGNYEQAVSKIKEHAKKHSRRTAWIQ